MGSPWQEISAPQRWCDEGHTREEGWLVGHLTSSYIAVRGFCYKPAARGACVSAGTGPRHTILTAEEGASQPMLGGRRRSSLYVRIPVRC